MQAFCDQQNVSILNKDSIPWHLQLCWLAPLFLALSLALGFSDPIIGNTESYPLCTEVGVRIKVCTFVNKRALCKRGSYIKSARKVKSLHCQGCL